VQRFLFATFFAAKENGEQWIFLKEKLALYFSAKKTKKLFAKF